MSAVFGLLGEKLGHSFSPQIHRELGGYAYDLLEVRREDLPDFFARRDFRAINVTIPYKQAVFPWLDTLSEAARKIGSVNTIVRDAQGRLHGYNTDYYGFTRMVWRSGIAIAGRKCLVLGSGGASKTVCACLRDMQAAQVVVISRQGPDNYQNIGRHADAQVIVNATPVGMYPNNGLSPVDLAGFPHLEGVVDLIYNPARTALLLQAESRGIPCMNGLYMLVAQAKQASELFRDTVIDDAELDRITKLIAAQTANIVLIGMPGCGKTTVGGLLARMTGRPFADIDALIAQRVGMTCGDIIRNQGEAAFRQLETSVLSEVCRGSGQVIATGGGVVTVPENRDLLRQNGVIFHLERPLEALALDGDRPLSATPERLRLLWQQRAPLYAAFRDHAIANEDAQQAAEDILCRLRGEENV